MSSGGWHLVTSVGVAAGVVAVDHLDLRALEVGLVAIAGGNGPDIDSGDTLVGSLVPQWIAPSIERRGWYGRRWFHVLPIRHRGVLHWPLTGLVIAVLIAHTWTRALWRSRLTVIPAPDFGLLLGATFLACWLLHLLMDDPRWRRAVA